MTVMSSVMPKSKTTLSHACDDNGHHVTSESRVANLDSGAQDSGVSVVELTDICVS